MNRHSRGNPATLASIPAVIPIPAQVSNVYKMLGLNVRDAHKGGMLPLLQHSMSQQPACCNLQRASVMASLVHCMLLLLSLSIRCYWVDIPVSVIIACTGNNNTPLFTVARLYTCCWYISAWRRRLQRWPGIIHRRRFDNIMNVFTICDQNHWQIRWWRTWAL